MEKNKPSIVTPQVILGIIIIFIGVVFMLDNLELIQAGSILRYWPALIVMYGVSIIIQARSNSSQVFGWILTVIGTLMLLGRMEIIYFRLWDWWPVILIVIGINFLFSARKRNKSFFTQPFENSAVDSDSYIKNTAMLGGIKRIITSKEFQGGEISAVMGGCEIDLRDAEIKGKEAVLDVNIIMGGIELRVPLGWTVIMEATPIMGGVEDKTYPAKEGMLKKLIITGSIIMGGVEIKN